MRPRCEKCGGILWGEADPWGLLVVKCLECSWQRTRHNYTQYAVLTVPEVKDEGRQYRGRSRGKRSEHVSCRVISCSCLVEESSSTGICRACWMKNYQWAKSLRTSLPPFIVHPEDVGRNRPRLLVNPQKGPRQARRK